MVDITIYIVAHAIGSALEASYKAIGVHKQPPQALNRLTRRSQRERRPRTLLCPFP